MTSNESWELLPKTEQDRYIDHIHFLLEKGYFVMPENKTVLDLAREMYEENQSNKQ